MAEDKTPKNTSENSNEKGDTGEAPKTRASEVTEEELEAASTTGESVKNIGEQMEEAEKAHPGKFGTFGGVFTPTVLTILGVIMFLREGWVVGNAGLLGAWLVILLSFTITACSGLSMSCFITNIRVGSGGAFSMISQSLGLEVGGSIGIPLYISQALAVCMYIFGFRAGWLWIFPEHPPLLVDSLVFAIVFVITFVSSQLAVRVQFFILCIIVLSLLSVGVAALTGSMEYDPVWWGSFPGDKENGFTGVSFWYVFAVFFPASTGIMAGANMSGELKNPKKSVPVGTMSAIGLSLVIYMALAYWLATSATPDELLNNYLVMVEKAFYGPLVLAGLLAATFSSALVSFVGAPRILQALSEHQIIPGSGWFARRKRGEPLNAIIFTSVIVFGALMMRDLNAIAPLITMFFLITYAAINLIVLVEQSLGLISFRPLLQIPRLVPLFGLAGCVTAMFIINPVLSLVSVVTIFAIYIYLLQRQLSAPFGDVRSGIFLAASEWAAKRFRMSEGSKERIWKPHLLVPTDGVRKVYGVHRLVYDLAHPTGSVKLLGISKTKEDLRELRQELVQAKESFQEMGVFCASSAIQSSDFSMGVSRGMEVLSGTIFRPNVLFLTLPTKPALQEEIQTIMVEARRLRLGVALLVKHPEAGLGRRHSINVWIRDHGPEWDISMRFDNLDLSLLLGYRLNSSWNGKLNLIVALKKDAQRDKASRFLNQLKQAARLPAQTQVFLADGDFGRTSSEAPRADLNIFPLGERLDAEFMLNMRDVTGASCLFVQDGGDESALA